MIIQEQIFYRLFTILPYIMQYNFLEIEYQQIIDMEQKTTITGPPRHSSASYINCIGLFQVLKEGKLVQYGFGLLFRRGQSLVTFSKYFQNDQKPGKIYFCKQRPLTQFIQLPQTSNLNQGWMHQYDVYTSASMEFLGAKHFFASIRIQGKSRLDKRLDSRVRMIGYEDIQDVNYCKGLTIQLMKISQELVLFAKEFIVNGIENLQLRFQAAILFMKKKTKDEENICLDYLQGFHENRSQREKQKDNYLYSEVLPRQSLRGGTGLICYADMLPMQVINHELIQPYRSIGILVNGEAKGTASFLYNKEQNNCSFLITCAHNFKKQIVKNGSKIQNKIVQISDSPQSFEQIKFLLKGPIPEKPERTGMIELEGFHIKSIYVPKQYFEEDFQVKTQFQYRQKYQKPIIQSTRFFDIAIIELKNPIEFHSGFRIRSSEKPYEDVIIDNIELSGFPGNNAKMTNLYPNMHKDTMKCHTSTSSFQLGKARQSDWRMIKHKLSTLGGNSGSPIYELSENGQCYLIGVHTAGIPIKNTINQQIYGIYNLATYLYSENIYSWLKTIPGIQSVIE